MSDHNQNNEAPDRNIPSVGRQRDYSRYGIILLIAVAIIAIIAVAADGIKDSKAVPLTKAQKITFKSVSTQDRPYIKKAEDKETVTKPVTNNDDEAFKRELRKQALKIARLEEQKRIERWQSPQLVYDSPAIKRPAIAKNQAGASAINASALSGQDQNANFAAAQTNATFKTANATMLQSPDTLVTQGTMIDGILETAIQSDLPGMVRAIVSEDVYSFDSSRLLIPRGSKLIGQYNSATVRGQSRVFIIWTRLIRHDGASIALASYGTDDLGRSGLGGRVDTHFFERFGSSVLLSMIDTGLKIGAQSLNDPNTSTVALETGSDFSRSAEIALENSIAIKPTIHIDQGTQIKVFAGQDLSFASLQESSK